MDFEIQYFIRKKYVIHLIFLLWQHPINLSWDVKMRNSQPGFLKGVSFTRQDYRML
jgi:hypothetical protein